MSEQPFPGEQSDRPAGAAVLISGASFAGLATAFWMIRLGYLDAAITGGSEAAITSLGVGGFVAMRALSTRNEEPAKASRPFDKERDGFVMSEGSAALILEERDGSLHVQAEAVPEEA